MFAILANVILNVNTDFNLPKLRGFKIAFLNIASLRKHIDEIRLNMQNQYLDVLVLNETRLDETICDSEMSIDKYTLVRNDRSRHGGGVAICTFAIQFVFMLELIYKTKP